MPPRRQRKASFVAGGIILGLFILLIPILILLSNRHVFGGNETADGFRNNYTEILGGGRDTVTVMVYVCGSDLESDGGCGTIDLNEMLEADLGDNVNVIVETGGCRSWDMPGIKDGAVQRWAIENHQLVPLQDLGKTGMLNAQQLVDFISFAKDRYPANRYELVFWDHGGGSLYGYGSDELYPDSVLFLSDMATALQNSGVKFDMIGFDACLMGTIETAYMLEPYADYLVGSEETEPADGWDYTTWLNALGQNTSIDTVSLGQIIVDSFLKQNADSGKNGSPDSTLSVVALREIPYVYETLCSYMSNATTALSNQEFKTISTAVSRSRAFAEGDYDLIDIVDFTTRSNLDGKDELVTALQSAVKYSNSTARTGVYGLSMYFPYKDLSVYGYAKKIFAQFGYGGEIYQFYDKFVNILAGGQKNSTTRSLKENLTGQTDAETDYSSFDWYDNTAVDNYTYDNINYTELSVIEDASKGNWYLPLSDEDWDLLTDVQMQILLDDGGGYIDLGSDQYYEKDDQGNLILNFGADYTWVAIGGQIVCYYAEETIQRDDMTVFIGYVPAVLNGQTDIDIILEWDGKDADGYIAGYRLVDSTSSIGGEGTVGKGYKQFSKGDKIDFICDYYTYKGKYDSSYYFGDTLVIGNELPAVTYEDVGDSPVLECYMLTDIYHNQSWTQTVKFDGKTT
ncbi:clostripain-related cysteine peptidase [Oscillospiraceae bacterium WX1]